jgi:hypothetical protein
MIHPLTRHECKSIAIRLSLWAVLSVSAAITILMEACR